MTRVKIEESGFDKFTGDMGGTEFVNGVSVGDLSIADVNRLGASVRVVEVLEDEEGGIVTGAQMGVGSVLAESRDVSYEVQAQDAQDGLDKEAYGDFKENEGEEIDAEEGQEAEEAKEALQVIYTKEQLEKIADEKGADGVREIAKKLDVKGRSIVELIKGIISAQEAGR